MSIVQKAFRKFAEEVCGTPSKNYCHNKMVREYIKFPKFLPLNVQIQHGWYTGKPYDLSLGKSISFMLLWNRRQVEFWKAESKIPVANLGAPFTHYRKMRGIEIKKDARGTVVFPNHSTDKYHERMNVHEYAEELRKLPEHMQPVTMCMHYRDIAEYGAEFEKEGFAVVTAGDSKQTNFGFAKRFYEILSSHRYATSNDIGSYTFYAVEMGIPFFLWGPLSMTVVRDNPEQLRTITEYHQHIRKIFTGLHDTITDEQREAAAMEMATFDAISPKELRSLLIKRFFLHELPRYPFRFIRAIFWRIPKMILKGIQ